MYRIIAELWRVHQRAGTAQLVNGRRYVLARDERDATCLMPVEQAAELAVKRAS